MAHLGDSVNSETPRIVLVAIQTVAVVALTTLAIKASGHDWILRAIGRLEFPYDLGGSVALWGGAMLLLARGRWIIVTALRLARSIIVLSLRISFIYAPAALPAAARLVMGDGYDALCLRVASVLHPVFAPVTSRYARWRNALAARRAALAREWTLRRAYHTEFYRQFDSYRSFRAAFDAQESEGQDATAKSDAFAAACRTLGLPEDGQFAEDGFRARYRELMKKSHPDIAGSNARAADINAARAVIRKRKGWV